MKITKNAYLMNLIFTLVIGFLVLILSIFNVFEKLDLRLYDGLLHFVKDPPMSSEIVMLEIGDEDISQLGEWPWSRDIMADALIRMKELGASTAVFDIEYINTSPKGIKSSSISKIQEKVTETEQTAADLLMAIPSALSNGYSAEEITDLSNDMVSSYLVPMYEDLSSYIDNNVASDNDEYFAKAIQFFGNAWITGNILDLGYKNATYTEEDMEYIKNRLLYLNVEDPHDFTSSDNKYNFSHNYPSETMGLTPTLNKIVQRSNGISFTNSNVDEDGVRRRNELLYEYDGKYLGQLVFGPLMNILGVTDITRTNHALILKDALVPGETERKNIRIPLDSHGQMLINWQHEGLNSDKTSGYCGIDVVPVRYLHMLDIYEEDIVNCLKYLSSEVCLFDENGSPYAYYEDISQLLYIYEVLTQTKDDLLNKCDGYDQKNNPINGNYISEEEYRDYFGIRKTFYTYLSNFISSYYTKTENTDGISKYVCNLIPEFYAQLGDSYGDVIANIEAAFGIIPEQYDYYIDTYNSLEPKLNNKHCVIGQTAASTTDIGAVPFVKQYANVAIHCNIMNTILTQNFITPYPWYYSFIVALVALLLLVPFATKSATFQNLLGGGVRIIVIAFFVLLFVLFKIYVPLVGPILVFLITDYLAGIIYRYLESSREKKFITEIASSFANKDTVAQLKANPDAFKTEGQKKTITALFSDIQKFSTLSESISKIYGDEGPNKLIEILNEYLGSMSNEILINSGNIDKYEGDAIISMFGAPDPMNSHTPEQWAYLCLDSAIRMKKAEVVFNETHKDMFNPIEILNEDGEKETIELKPLQTRIGINSGEAFVGLMGSKTESFSKLNYTMIGDTVNLASRLEGVNKAYASWIMCSEDTWKMANTGDNEGKITVRRLDKVRVVGRSTPVQLYNVIGFTEELSVLQKEQLAVFEEALDKYLNKDFVEAGKLFVEASKMLKEGDETALIFADRCKNYVKKGVSENWDGVMNMTSK